MRRQESSESLPFVKQNKFYQMFASEFEEIVPTLDLKEYEDHIEFEGTIMKKPFVEKPANGEDHNIKIYYPSSAGGGHKWLFRKIDNICSLFVPFVNKIRRDKSYIYEEFIPTDGFDIKAYTITAEYVHAEARKAPTLDGRVIVSK